VAFLSKLLLWLGLALFAVKLLTRGGQSSLGRFARLRELGRRLDRAVNVILVLLVVSYSVYAILWLLEQP
jgi:hypothetical protein